ncbi:MAG: GNAT family N-acetyltransferase [Parachlamydiaceae bacterium]|nr:GNAT family N-acetyltransferase [Parachlamydiaceae bacterium]
MIKSIIVTPYNPEWPRMFEAEATNIKQALGKNCLAVHHVGSTAVPELSAKPKIDIIAVVKDPTTINTALEKLGYEYRGEFNIPMHYGFNKRGKTDVNLHVYEEGNPEIELNLLFRNYLRNHPEIRDEYTRLKEDLLKNSASHEKANSMFTGYNLGKDAFIRKVLQAAHFSKVRILRCTHYAEWDVAKKLREQYFFGPIGIADPYTWTFDHKDHLHVILYHGVEMIGYAHIQLWPNYRSALRILVIDQPYQQHGLGSKFLHLCERWLKKLGIRSLHDEARPSSVAFYRKNGYVEMPFDEPSGEPPSAQDVAMGKIL